MTPDPMRSMTTAIVLGAVLAFLCGWPLPDPTTEPAEVLAARVLRIVEEHYVEPVDGQELLRSGIDRVIQSLDRNSRYFSPAEARQFEQETGGFLYGIGVILRESEQQTHLVERVLPDGPASSAGILTGDQIISVDGESALNWNLSRLSTQLRGERDTMLDIGISRNEQQLTVTVQRDEVRIPSVTEIAIFTAQDGSSAPTGLVRLQQFQPNSTSELKKAIEAIIADGAQGIVLDLRGNSGGLFTEAVSISSLFLEAGLTVVKTRGRSGEKEEQVSSVSRPGPFRQIPLVILIDGSSASASEIVAASLRDHLRAALVGSASFGKWTAQDLIYITNKSEPSLLKLTTQSFHPPEGIRVSRDETGKASGLIPDLAVAISPETAFQIASANRSRSFDRIEQPDSIANLATPDPQATVDLLGNGDPVLSAALQLLSQPERLQTLLNQPSTVSKEESR